MQSLAVVPARGGSQGIPGKNLTNLGSVPLIGWTLASLKASNIDRIIVSTDDKKIGEFCTQQDVQIVHQPFPWSAGTAHASGLVMWVLNYLRNELGEKWPEVVGMFLPTSPFRSSDDIDGALKLFGGGAESVIGVEKTKPLATLRKKRDGYLVPMVDNPTVQRQDAEQLYRVNGAIFLTAPTTLMEYKTFHTPKAVGYYMSRVASIEIDELDDLVLARMVVQ